jgi:peptidoglycan biosynthesis/recognition FemAB-like protein
VGASATEPNGGPFAVSVLRGLGSAREQCETELIQSGAVLPLPHRIAWEKLFPEPVSWFLAVRDEAGHCRGGLAVKGTHSRVLPGHLFLRASRCGPMKVEGALEAALGGLASLGRNNHRVLRVNIELFSPDSAVRSVAAETLAGLGFHRSVFPRGYSQTISVDLSPDEETIFARLHKKTRRDIRATAKHPLQVREITDSMFAGRMEAMREATYARTGGAFVRQDWVPVIEFCRRYPELCRLVGQFRSDTTGPNSLLAYAWGLHHGDNAQYHTAASVRDESINVPLAYSLIWDLICWAKKHGASWFDMGGVTPGRTGDTDDRLGGISDFKRYFSKTVVEVGEEWEWEPRRVQAKLARILVNVAGWFSRDRRS